MPGTTDAEAAAESLALSDAIHGGDANAIESVRETSVLALGPEAAVDACAVAAAFHGNNVATAATGCRVPDTEPSAGNSSACRNG